MSNQRNDIKAIQNINSKDIYDTLLSEAVINIQQAKVRGRPIKTLFSENNQTLEQLCQLQACCLKIWTWHTTRALQALLCAAPASWDFFG